MKRFLTEREIQDITSNVLKRNFNHFNLFPKSMKKFYINQITRLLEDKLKNIQIVPEGIELLKEQLFRTFKRVDSGCAVGILCGQSIGEKQTQTTLNTFHRTGLSDKQVVAETPRFLEIIDTNQSSKQSTPSCFIYLNDKPQTIQKAREIIKSHLLYIDLKYLVETWIISEVEEKTWYIEEYKLENNADLCTISIKFNMNNLFKYKITLQEIKNKIEAILNSQKTSIYFKVFSSPLFMGKMDIIVIEQDLSMIQNILFKSHLFGIENISSIFFTKDMKTQEWYVETSGSNLEEITKLDFVDIFRTYSNDFWEMYNLYGIDTLRQYLVYELDNLLQSIHFSHISLLVDRMTRTGYLKSISRYTRKNERSSVISKATFEETLNIFTRASIEEEEDNTLGISASIICNKVAPIGTGMNELVL